MIVLPQKFEEILKQDTSGCYAGAVDLTRSRFGQIFSENRLYFFEEYTDHGIRHINSVLAACASLITPDTYKLLTEKDISILVLSVFLHDLGMHLQPLTFKKMITSGYYDDLNAQFDDQKWSVLWESYLFEAKKFNDQQRIRIFGDASVYITEPNLNKPDSLTGIDKKLIGEFIRRHHPRIAFEVAFKGLITHEEAQIDFCAAFDYKHRLLAGLLARSHGMNIRDTFPFLEKHFTKRVWRRPLEVHIVYLMAVLRLADYFQIDKTRVLKVPFLTRLFQSPVSFDEHQKHLQTTYIQQSDDDPETLYITAEPISSTFFLALENLFSDIQKEVDSSWAVLGEIYGLKPYEEQPKLTYRRIQSNIDDKRSFEATVPYVPEKISFTVDKEVPKLLVGPLYNYEPTYGVRELLQNAVDACWEREFYEKKLGNDYSASILVKIEPLDEHYLLSIIDNGKGMTLEDIKNYFLKVGGSFRKSAKWQQDHIDEDGHSNINKSGRFGIGVLAAFLLGTEIEVKTKNISSTTGYSFRTALDQSQIEITKIQDLNYGTTITITLAKDKLRHLDIGYNKGDLFSLKHIRFDEWFVLQTPEIRYQIPKYISRNSWDIKEFHNEHFPDLNESNFYWNEIQDKDYRKILWSYPDGNAGTVICNGFVVPDRYALNDRKLSPPTLMIFDFDARLPLNLNRTSLDCPLPFNNLLEMDIYRDIIASLLVKEVENIFVTHRIEEKSSTFDHPALDEEGNRGYLSSGNDRFLHLVLGKDGFYLSMPIIFRQLVGLNYLIIFCWNDSELNEKFNVKYLVENSEIDLISIIDLSEYDDPDQFLEKIALDLLKKKDVAILGYSNDIYTIVENESPIHFNGNIQKVFLQKGAKDISMIYLENRNITIEKDRLSKLLIDLLGDDLLIPYGLEDRKKKFPKAFKELEPYMRKYLDEK